MALVSLTLIVGAAAAVGAAVAWLAAAAKLRTATAEGRLLRDQLDKIAAELATAHEAREQWRSRAEQEGRARVAAEAAASRVGELESQCQELRRQLLASSAENAGLKTKLTEQDEAYREKVEALTSIRGEIAQSLNNLTNESLRSSQATFLKIANEVFDKHRAGAAAELNALVSPIRETLQAYEADLAKLEGERRQSVGALSAELRQVVEATQTVRTETSRLVNALRAAPKTRGRWGETTLRNVLELAGLNPYSDFLTERSYDREGGRVRPDVVIRLPGGRSIVVDAKAPIAAYLDAVDAVDETVREQHLRAHAQQLRNQVKILAAKSYWDGLTETPEFVVMFVPGENFYAAAAERDPGLFEFAWKERVLIVTPATLIGLAKAVAYSWRQEKIADNARRVHELGRELYKRLATMGGHVVGLGKSLGASVQKYNDFIGSLESSVMPQARRFYELEIEGAGTELPALVSVDLEPRPLRPGRDVAFSVPTLAAPPPAAD
jgi:DNA recombination protein RmuC